MTGTGQRGPLSEVEGSPDHFPGLLADDAQMTATFDEQRASGIYDGLRGRLTRAVADFRAEVFREVT